jgi:hypothetical protein
MQTERVTFLTSPDHKAALDAFAASNGKSVGHVLREASTHYIAQPSSAKYDEQAEEEELSALLIELAAAAPEMRASLERSTKLIEDTTREVEAMLRASGLRDSGGHR